MSELPKISKAGDELDIVTSRLAESLFSAYQGLFVYEWVGTHVPALQELGVSGAFGYVQYMAQRQCALGLSATYENNKHHKLGSVPGVIKVLSGYSPYIRKDFDKALKGLGLNDKAVNKIINLQDEDFKDGMWIGELNKVRPTSENNKIIQSWKRFRDENVAHFDMEYEPKRLMPSLEQTEELLDWAYRFHQMVCDFFISNVSGLDSKYWAKRHSAGPFNKLFKQLSS